MATHLDEILEATRLRVADEVRKRSLNDLERELSSVEPPRDFLSALAREGMSLIGEIKRSSPSAGVIRADAAPDTLAKSYEEGGARAISVLTEPEFFNGSLEDLQSARFAVDVPVLRKDFVVDPYQVIQARGAGADAVLLIVGAVRDRGLFAELAEAAKSCGVAALVEVHDEYELERAFEVTPRLVGVNQRDLRTFEVDTSLALRLRREVPRDVVMVAESGIKSRRDVEALEKAEVDAVLVGETLMLAEDPSEAIRELLGTRGRDGE